jgi:hypothetical protein
MAVDASRINFAIGDIVEHLKTGNLYCILGFGRLEKNLEDVVIYVEATKNGPLNDRKPWIRPHKEFANGRFLKTYY